MQTEKPLEDQVLKGHSADDSHCQACAEGFPQPCPCGGLMHASIMQIDGNGLVQLTECDQCGGRQ